MISNVIPTRDIKYADTVLPTEERASNEVTSAAMMPDKMMGPVRPQKDKTTTSWRAMLIRRPWLPWLWLALLPILVHIPALSGCFKFDPLYVVSGLSASTWQTNGWLAGYPGWIDGNAGVTTEALGALAARQWLSGQVPWWNPYSGVGLPLVAEGQTTALFLPFGLLLALPHGLLLLRVLLMALAGLFTYALLRRLDVGLLPATTGAVLFELNGTFAWFAHGPIMPIAFLPLLLLGLEQARQGVFPMAAILGTAWNFLGGFPETAALNLLFAGTWAALRWAQSPARAAFALRAGGAVLCGLLLAAPGVWPFLEALPREFLSSHSGTIGGWQRANVALMLFPYSHGNLMAESLRGQDPDIGWYRVGGYVDLVLAALALAALRLRAPEVALRATLAGWLAVTAARGAGWGPAVALFGLVPLLRQAAVHLYVMPSWSMAAATLAAFTLQDWQAGRRPAWIVPTLALGPLAVGALLWSAKLIAAAPVGLAALAITMPALMLTAAGWMLFRPSTARRLRIMAVLLCSHAAVLFVLPLFAGTRGRRLDVPAIRFLQEHAGLARVATFGPMVPNYGAMFGIAEINHNYLPVPQLWVDAIRARLQPGSDGVNFYYGGLLEPMMMQRVLPPLQEMGTAYALTWASQKLAGIDGLRPVYRDDLLVIWALPDPAPYVTAKGCRLAVTRYTVTADCPAPARLLRRELFWPGWSAAVNGAPARVYPVDIFQGVDLPAGRSNVVFHYSPPRIFFAWVACAVGGVVLLLAGIGGGGRLKVGQVLAAPSPENEPLSHCSSDGE